MYKLITEHYHSYESVLKQKSIHETIILKWFKFLEAYDGCFIYKFYDIQF